MSAFEYLLLVAFFEISRRNSCTPIKHTNLHLGVGRWMREVRAVALSNKRVQENVVVQWDQDNWINVGHLARYECLVNYKCSRSLPPSCSWIASLSVNYADARKAKRNILCQGGDWKSWSEVGWRLRRIHPKFGTWVSPVSYDLVCFETDQPYMHGIACPRTKIHVFAHRQTHAHTHEHAHTHTAYKLLTCVCTCT